MYPSFLATLKASPSVTGLFGSNPQRIGVRGSLGQAPTLPYCSLQLVGGDTENYLSGASDMDRARIQFNVYAATQAAANQGAAAIRAALEGVGYLVSFNGDGEDPDTKNQFYSFDIEFHSER